MAGPCGEVCAQVVHVSIDCIMCAIGFCRRGGSTGSKGQLIRITCAIRASIFTTVPRDFRLDDRFGGFN